MTSSEFFKTINHASRQGFESCGFRRLKTASVVWSWPIGGRYLLVSITKSPKRPYLKPMGGLFEIWAHVVKTEAVQSAHGGNSFSFLRYLTDADLAEMKRLRVCVLQKIIGQTAFDSDFDRAMYDLQKPVLEMTLSAEMVSHQSRPLEYLDKEDVKVWGEFIGSKVPLVVCGAARDGDALFESLPEPAK